MKKIVISLINPDETFETQTKIVNGLLDAGLIEQKEVISINDYEILLELFQAINAPKVKTKVITTYRPYVNIQQSSFDDGGGAVNANTSDSVTSGSSENVSTFDQNGEGAGSGIVVGIGEGMGNANLKGTTFIAGNDKRRSRINLDEIIHDQSQYTATEYPQITYAQEQSTLYLPATQTSYSVGQMTKADVKFLNKKFEEQFSIFSSDFDENKGTIIPPVASAADVVVNHNMTPGAPKPDESRVLSNGEIRELSENRSKDARDPDNSPALVNTKAELIAIIRKGQMPNQTQVQEAVIPALRKIEERLTPKEELIQRMLAFNERFGIDQMAYSITSAIGSYATKRATTKLVQQAVANKAEEHLGPGTGQLAAKASKPAAQVVGKQAGKLASSLLK